MYICIYIYIYIYIIYIYIYIYIIYIYIYSAMKTPPHKSQVPHVSPRSSPPLRVSYLHFQLIPDFDLMLSTSDNEGGPVFVNTREFIDYFMEQDGSNGYWMTQYHKPLYCTHIYVPSYIHINKYIYIYIHN